MDASEPSGEEHYEFRPWSMLESSAAPEKQLFLRTLIIGFGVAALIGLSILVWRGRSRPEPPPSLAGAPTAAVVPSDMPAEAPPEVVARPPTTLALLSEADLMALSPSSAEASAMAVAEAFVFDYYTADPAGPTRSIAETVPDWSATRQSYVEWVRAIEAAPEGDLVAVRTLFSLLMLDPFERLDIRTVDILVRVSSADVTVVDLPRRVESPMLVRTELATYREVPVEIAASVPAVEVLAGRETDNGWMLVVLDETGFPATRPAP